MSDREKQRVVFAVIATSITVALIWFSFSDEAAPKLPAPLVQAAPTATDDLWADVG
jgi:hypothetical protein